jgi:hypothetical protein
VPIKMIALERAFQVARSGEVSRIDEIIAILKRDGYDANQMHGPALRRQLVGLMRAARQAPVSEDPVE